MRDLPLSAKWFLGSVACFAAAFGAFRAARGADLSPRWAGAAGWLDLAVMALSIFGVLFACFSVASLGFVRKAAQLLVERVADRSPDMRIALQALESIREQLAATEARGSATERALVAAEERVREAETARETAEERAREAWANKVGVSLSIEDLYLWKQGPITIETALESSYYSPVFAVLRVESRSPRPLLDVLARIEYLSAGNVSRADGTWSSESGDRFVVGGSRTVNLGVGDHRLLVIAAAVSEMGACEGWTQIERDEMPPRFIYGKTPSGRDVLQSRHSGNTVELSRTAEAIVRLSAEHLNATYRVHLAVCNGSPTASLEELI